MKQSIFTTSFFLLLTLLLTGVKVFAQISDTDYSSLQVSAGLNTIFCPSNATFTLTASANDGNGNTYASYKWFEKNASGGADIISGQNSAQLQLSNATPGYHTYRVFGITDFNDGVTCQSDAFDDFTVYVLPPLDVAATVPAATTLKYCTNNIPQSGDAAAIVLTANIAGFTVSPNQVDGLPNHASSEFAYDYKWYRVDAQNNRFIVGSNQNSYTVTGNEVGTFTYQVDISYKVKNTCAVYTTTVQSNGADAQIIVTPVPGKPTITIN